MSKPSIFSRIQGAVRGGGDGHRRNQVDIISTNADVYAKTQLTDTGGKSPPNGVILCLLTASSIFDCVIIISYKEILFLFNR